MQTLPHHKLIAFGVAKEMLLAVKSANIREAGLRDQALRAAKSACLNCAEGAGRVTRADKARVFAIARGEAVEAAAAVEIAAACGSASEADVDAGRGARGFARRDADAAHTVSRVLAPRANAAARGASISALADPRAVEAPEVGHPGRFVTIGRSFCGSCWSCMPRTCGW